MNFVREKYNAVVSLSFLHVSILTNAIMIVSWCFKIDNELEVYRVEMFSNFINFIHYSLLVFPICDKQAKENIRLIMTTWLLYQFIYDSDDSTIFKCNHLSIQNENRFRAWEMPLLNSYVCTSFRTILPTFKNMYIAFQI